MHKSIINIAFLGPKGSYSHFAAKKYTYFYLKKKSIIEHSCHKFSEIFTLVENNHVEYGILPLENSNSGLINEVCNLLINTTLILINEIFIPIKHNLLVNNNNITLDQIKIIYSHPQPVLQCSKFLKFFSKKWKIISCESSASAMQIVSTQKNQSTDKTAALGSIEGGKLYGLYPLLSSNLSNHHTNVTRFIILKKATKKIINNPYLMTHKTMFIILIDHKQKPNTILNILKFYNIHVTLFKSHTTTFSKQITKIIILQIKSHLTHTHTQEAIKKIHNSSQFVKILNYNLNYF